MREPSQCRRATGEPMGEAPGAGGCRHQRRPASPEPPGGAAQGSWRTRIGKGISLVSTGIAGRVAGAGRLVSPGGAASYRLPSNPPRGSAGDRCGGGGGWGGGVGGWGRKSPGGGRLVGGGAPRGAPRGGG